MAYTNLIKVLMDEVELGPVTVLPDFFLDHFVIVENLDNLLNSIKTVARQGGGNILDNTQLIRRGGNAVNTASALHRLKVRTAPIVTTDEFGLGLLQRLVDSSLNLSHVHTDGALSATVSLEGEYNGRKANVMISDSGSAREFKFKDLNQNDLDAIKKSKVVVLVNLNHNFAAIELTEELFEFVKSETDAVTYLDIGDPSNRPEMLDDLVENTLPSGLVDILGVNENEVAWLFRSIHGTSSGWDKIVSTPTRWLPCAKEVSEETQCRVDLHTPFFSSTIQGSDVVSVPGFRIEERTLCGAGDAWNAGNIFGILRNLGPKDRLTLSNAVAALYVSSKDASHPRFSDIIGFLESSPQSSVHMTKLLKSDRE